MPLEKGALSALVVRRDSDWLFVFVKIAFAKIALQFVQLDEGVVCEWEGSCVEGVLCSVVCRVVRWGCEVELRVVGRMDVGGCLRRPWCQRCWR